MQDYFRFKNGTFHKRQKKSAIDSKRCSFITEYFELQFDTATLTIPSFRMIKATFQTKVQTRTISFSFVICFCFVSSLLLSSSTRRRFYRQRSSGQVVVIGVVPSPPRHMPSVFIARRVQHSHCSSIFIECCYLTLSRFPLINFYARTSPYEYVHSVRTELAKLILVGTGISCYTAGATGL